MDIKYDEIRNEYQKKKLQKKNVNKNPLKKLKN